MLSTRGGLLMTVSVAAKGATPSCRQASDLSEFAMPPKLDHVVPPLVLFQNGPDDPGNDPDTIWVGSSGSTARLGSEFCPVSLLTAFGMTSMTVIARAA